MSFGDEWDFENGGSFDTRGDYRSDDDDFAGAGAAGATSRYVPAPSEREAVFSVTRLDRWKVSSKDTVTHVAVGNSTAVIVTGSGQLIRWETKSDPDPLKLPIKDTEKVHKVFIDPTGCHVLFTVVAASVGGSSRGTATPPTTYYMHKTRDKIKEFKPAKGVVIESVAWDRARGTIENTGFFLCGSNDGRIFEAQLDTHNNHNRIQEWKPVHDLGLRGPVCGLQFERFPGSGSEPTTFFVMAATANPTRSYTFVGGDTFSKLFASASHSSAFTELPSNLAFSELHFYNKHAGGASNSFALFTGVGIYHGKLQYSSSGDSVISETSLMPFPPRGADPSAEVDDGDGGRRGGKHGGGGSGGGGARGDWAGGAASGSGSGGAPGGPELSPISMGITEFHFLLLYPDGVAAVSKISQEIVWQDRFGDRLGKMLSLVRDPANNFVWATSDKHLFQVLATHEGQNVWKLYLDKAQSGTEGRARGEAARDFELALSNCRDDDQRETVRTAQADYFFDKGDFAIAAAKYAATKRPFEEVALKFIESDDRGPLKTFLILKLRSLDKTQKTQKTILCTWLTEIYLDQINTLEEENAELGDADREAELLVEFEAFLVDYQDCLDPPTTYNLISSHGRVDELLFYAERIGDFERVLAHHMQRKDYEEALNVLRDAQPEEQAERLFYKFSPTLILEVPEQTVRVWKKCPFLQPSELIPSLVRYSQQREAVPAHERTSPDQAILYLEHCVRRERNEEPAIHNYLLSLYAKQASDEKLIAFILSQCRGGRSTPIFDLKYALRVCMREHKLRACVRIYAAMQLYEEAVQLALEVSVDLATEHADMPREDNEELSKKLWLRIAQHVLDRSSPEEGVRNALQLLEECDLLKIEDILPHFPKTVKLDQFKAEICDSLDEVNTRIDELKDEMQEYTKSADRIRTSIKALRNRCGFVSGNQKCEVCGQLVLQRSLYLFPCTHAFHADCLIDKVMPHLNRRQQERVSELLAKIKSMPAKPTGPASVSPMRVRPGAAAAAGGAEGKGDDASAHVPTRDELQTVLDEIVAGECLFCGEIMINSVGEPLGDADIDDPSEWDIERTA